MGRPSSGGATWTTAPAYPYGGSDFFRDTVPIARVGHTETPSAMLSMLDADPTRLPGTKPFRVDPLDFEQAVQSTFPEPTCTVGLMPMGERPMVAQAVKYYRDRDFLIKYGWVRIIDPKTSKVVYRQSEGRWPEQASVKAARRAMRGFFSQRRDERRASTPYSYKPNRRRNGGEKRGVASDGFDTGQDVSGTPRCFADTDPTTAPAAAIPNDTQLFPFPPPLNEECARAPHHRAAVHPYVIPPMWPHFGMSAGVMAPDLPPSVPLSSAMPMAPAHILGQSVSESSHHEAYNLQRAQMWSAAGYAFPAMPMSTAALNIAPATAIPVSAAPQSAASSAAIARKPSPVTALASADDDYGDAEYGSAEKGDAENGDEDGDEDGEPEDGDEEGDAEEKVCVSESTSSPDKEAARSNSASRLTSAAHPSSASPSKRSRLPADLVSTSPLRRARSDPAVTSLQLEATGQWEQTGRQPEAIACNQPEAIACDAILQALHEANRNLEEV